LKAFFVGDSEFALREFRKSLVNPSDLASVIVGGRRSFSVDFGGKSLP
jgi:hypothetical protein